MDIRKRDRILFGIAGFLYLLLLFIYPFTLKGGHAFILLLACFVFFDYIQKKKLSLIRYTLLLFFLVIIFWGRFSLIWRILY